MTANAILQFSPVPAYFCCGWVKSPLCIPPIHLIFMKIPLFFGIVIGIGYSYSVTPTVWYVPIRSNRTLFDMGLKNYFISKSEMASWIPKRKLRGDMKFYCMLVVYQCSYQSVNSSWTLDTQVSDWPCMIFRGNISW